MGITVPHISDSTGTVSGTVLARSNVGPVWSGLGTFFVLEPEHAIHRTESWCVAHGERWGVVRRECEQQMSVSQYLTPARSTQQAGRRATHRPSWLLLMTLERTGHLLSRYHAHGHP